MTQLTPEEKEMITEIASLTCQLEKIGWGTKFRSLINLINRLSARCERLEREVKDWKEGVEDRTMQVNQLLEENKVLMDAVEPFLHLPEDNLHCNPPLIYQDADRFLVSCARTFFSFSITLGDLRTLSTVADGIKK